MTNHYPSCVCEQNYGGNPQLGCTKRKFPNLVYKLDNQKITVTYFNRSKFPVECESSSDCAYTETCYNNQCINPCLLENECAVNAECFGANHQAACRCASGYFGNPKLLCERVECNSNYDCDQSLSCQNNHCVNPCSIQNPCARNAICYVNNHAAACRCPEYAPLGNPFSYCEKNPPISIDEPECMKDADCPTKMACISDTCVDPCPVIKPCLEGARCSVLDTIPVRTMVCTCPEGWVTDSNGVCQPSEFQLKCKGCKRNVTYGCVNLKFCSVSVLLINSCTSDDECDAHESCVNRRCRDPCSCGANAECIVTKHRPICSCKQGYQGNANIACYAAECQRDSECTMDKSCVNNNCVNPCLLADTCGINAECYVHNHVADCKCSSGYHGMQILPNSNYQFLSSSNNS